MHAPLAAVISSGLLCLAGSAFAQSADTFSARLTMMPIEVATSANVTGSGSAAATLDGRQLSVSGSFSGLQGPATAVRLHEGLALGIRGVALFGLVVESATNGSFSGEMVLTGEQIESLNQGRLYLQIDSEAAPDGNLWGWLLP